MKTEFVNIYINRYGYVFPSCKTYKDLPIGHLEDDSLADKVFKYFGHRFCFFSITVEFSSFCHANCTYCFQKDGVYIPYPFFNELEKFLCSVKTERLFFSGGEILDQNETMSFLGKLRKKINGVHFHLKTNGNVSLDKASYVANTFDSVVVSLNGFKKDTCMLLMGNNIDVSKTKRFICELVKYKNINVGIKFLLSPLVVSEIISFFNWASSIKPRSIIFQTAYIYHLKDNGISERVGTTFVGSNEEYWSQIVSSIKAKMKQLIKTKKYNCGFNMLICDKETSEILNFDEELNSCFRMDGLYDLEDRQRNI